MLSTLRNLCLFKTTPSTPVQTTLRISLIQSYFIHVSVNMHLSWVFTDVFYCMFLLTYRYTFFFAHAVWNRFPPSAVSTYIYNYLNMQRAITLLNWQTKFIPCLFNWLIRHNHNTFLDKKGHWLGLVKGVVFFSYFNLTTLSGQNNVTVPSKWRLPNGMQSAHSSLPKSGFYWFR